MKLTFSSTITSASTETRIITGQIVPWGEVGSTSAGRVIFEPGSIQIKSGKTKLLADHDNRNVLGSMISSEITSTGIIASFRIANTNLGNDCLQLAADGLKDGLSVGVDVKSAKPKDGVLYVSMSDLSEVSLVESAAFSSAAVYTVAASETEEEPTPEETPTPTPKEESEAPMSEQAPEVEPETVEASRKHIPVAYTEIRSPIVSPGSYAQHSIRATLGNEDSIQYVRAADAKAQRIEAANDSFTTNPAFTPVQYLSQVVSTDTYLRPAVEASGGTRAMMNSGMVISIPKITTNSTVASTAEAGTPSNTGIVSSYITGNVTKYAGQQTYSVEIGERSDPAFFDVMMANLSKAYAKATDAAVVAALTAGGTQATAVAATSDGIISYVATESPATYRAMGNSLAQNYLAGTSQWSLLLGATDTTGRPIYNAQNLTMNAAGDAKPTSLRGNVLGLDLYVDANVVSTTINESAFIIDPDALEIFESPQLRLSTNIVSSGEIQIMLYGYLCPIVTIAGGIRRFKLA